MNEQVLMGFFVNQLTPSMHQHPQTNSSWTLCSPVLLPLLACAAPLPLPPAAPPPPPSGVTHAAVKPWKDSTGAYRFAGSLTD
jgi:hypothetical protein